MALTSNPPANPHPTLPEIDDEVKERERQVRFTPTAFPNTIPPLPHSHTPPPKAEMKSEDLEGKPENIKEKMVEGRLGKILKTKVLMDQPYIRDTGMTIEDLVKSYISTLGENIQVRRGHGC